MERQKRNNLDYIIEMVCNAAEYQGKECFLASLANIACEPDAPRRLLAKGITKKLSPYLEEENINFQEKVAGIFRNISVTGGEEACLIMIRDDILTYLGPSITKNVKQILNAQQCDDKDMIEKLSCCLMQLIILLWNLSEASNLAVKAFNEDKLLAPLMTLVTFGAFDLTLMLHSAQCLYTLSEDNEHGMLALANETSFNDLVTIVRCHHKSPKHLFLSSVVTGILFNIRNILHVEMWLSLVEDILVIITVALEEPRIDDYVPKMVQDWHDYLSSQKICLELLANMLCSEDEQETAEVEEDDEMSGQSNDQTGADVNSEMKQLVLRNNFSDAALYTFLSKNAIPVKIMNCIEYHETKNAQSLKDSPETENLYNLSYRIQKSALACMSNLIARCSSNFLAHTIGLQAMWTKIFELARRKFVCEYGNDNELHEGLTCLLGAIAIKSDDNKVEQILNEEAVRLFEIWYMAFEDDQSKCNILKILGAGGMFYSRQSHGRPILEGIASILMSSLDQGNSLFVIAEALSATFDVFGEDGIADDMLTSSGLQYRLCQLTSVLQTKKHADKHLHRDHLLLIENSKTNLRRFIEYKQWTPVNKLQ